VDLSFASAVDDQSLCIFVQMVSYLHWSPNGYELPLGHCHLQRTLGKGRDATMGSRAIKRAKFLPVLISICEERQRLIG
jgi:hypothetical protein